MKKIMILIICLYSLQLQAACKCNCDFADNRICASQNDLDNPCPSVCAASAPGVMPMFTACPMVKIIHLRTGISTWVNKCEQ
jgi:hypothetical protein